MVRTSDGRNVVLQEPIDLADDHRAFYRVPEGSESDGASIPQELWSAGLAPFGDYWLAAIVHDSAYRGTLLRQLDTGEWAPAMLSKEACDTLLLDCMGALHVSQVTKEAIYEGVRFGGWRAFREDRGINA